MILKRLPLKLNYQSASTSKEGNMPMEDEMVLFQWSAISTTKLWPREDCAPFHFGTIPKSKTHPKQQWRARTIQWRKKVTNSEGDQIMQSAPQLEIQQSEEDQKIMAEADVSDIMDMINEDSRSKSPKPKSRARYSQSGGQAVKNSMRR